MKFNKKINLKNVLILLLIIVTPVFFTMFTMSPMGLTNIGDFDSNEESENEVPISYNNFNPKTSDTIYTGTKYNLSEWWDTRFRFRVGIEVEELEGIDRYEPVDVYLTFEDNEHFEDSARLVSFNATGADEWSSEIPIQLWNVTKYGSGFIESCTVTFLADVSASSNQTYFLYFNENLDNIGIPSYNTDFTSTLAGGKLTVTVGNLGDIYKAVLEEGKGSTDLIKNALNFHTDDSLSPERQLDHSSLSFLAHMDEGFGDYINDSTGNESPGQMINSPTWADGIVKGGVDFEQSSSQYAIFYDALENTARGDPFSDFSTAFTITAWIKPESISSTQRSNHRTYNCFMAKAGDFSNDNFEVGVNNDGTIHVYLDTERRDTYANFGNAGDVSVGQWNFIAIRYDSGTVDVRINSNWYSSTAWRSAQDLDGAAGSEFTIGSTDNVNTYFDGVIDEVAVYNISLSNQEIDDYKFGSETSVIQSITEIENGEVFSRYEVNWTESFNMHVSDICTFYYDYNLWNINRSLYFDELFVGNESSSQIVALNTYYDLSGLSQNQDFEYYYDNNYVSGLDNDGFTVENYTIVHDPIHLTTRNTLGIFVPNFYKTGEVQSFITYFKGQVYYDSTDQTVKYTPGSLNDYNNNGNPNNKLHIELWEYIDNVFTPSSQLFENMYTSLKNPVNLYVYETDNNFFSLKVNVTDIDNNIVPEAKITLWNATDSNMNWTQYTNDDGETTFTRLNNGSYIVNASYEKYGKPELTITSSQLADINEGTTDSTGLKKVSFEDVHLTSLNLTLNRYNSTPAYQGPLEGAQVSFWRNEGAGPEFIGSENSDENGNVVFRWKNFTGTTEGNITFAVDWFDIAPVEVIAPGDLDGITLNNYVTFYFHTANSSTVNCTFGQSFETDLTLTVLPDPNYNQMIGDLLNFQVNFTYSNETDTFPILGATVTYDIKLGLQVINTQTLSFFEIGGGLYNLTINTSNPVEPGGVNWFSEIDYEIEISAFKSGFISDEDSTWWTLDPRSTTLVGNESILAAYWDEFLIMDVTYTDVSFGASNPIDGATLQYYVEEDDTVVGSLIPYGSNGRYQLVIATTDFPKSGNYDLHITATKQNYQFQDIKVELAIEAIKSLINNTVGIVDDIDLAYKEIMIFYFNYTIESSGAPLDAADTRTYEWTKQIGESIVDSGAGSISDQGNGIYALDFDTENQEIATYKIFFSIEKDNYAERGGIIILNIVPREFNIILPSDRFENKIISAVSGKTLIFTIDVQDNYNGSYITDCNAYLTLEGEQYDFVSLGNGSYSVSISDLPNAFFLNIPVRTDIIVNKINYATGTEEITINVKIVEIFPGFPMFYFLIIVIGIAAVVGSLVTMRAIQKARIPTFVKKAREMSKNIKGKKTISDSLMYPTKEQYSIKKLGEKWEILGLSLEEILGFETKKKKKLPEFSIQEGGVM